MDRPQRPFFRPGVGGIDKRFGQIDFAAVAQVLGQPLEDPLKPAAALPLLKAAVAGLIGRIASRQIMPRGPGAEHPEHAVQDGARIAPRPAPAIRAAARTKRRFQDLPLLVSEVHTPTYDGPRNFVHRPILGFMR